MQLLLAIFAIETKQDKNSSYVLIKINYDKYLGTVNKKQKILMFLRAKAKKNQ